MVIDGETVVTGSFNFTKAAEENNAKNLLVVRHKKLADRLPRAHKGYLALQTGIIPPFVKAIKNIRTVKMKEKKVEEGITVIPTPGHTPGSISV